MLFVRGQRGKPRNGVRGVSHGQGQLLSVMDGHGGISAAEKVADNLESFFSDALRKKHGKVANVQNAVMPTLAANLALHLP